MVEATACCMSRFINFFQLHELIYPDIANFAKIRALLLSHAVLKIITYHILRVKIFFVKMSPPGHALTHARTHTRTDGRTDRSKT